MDDLHCSTVSAALGHRPGGTSTRALRFVLAELPPPWPSNIEDHGALAGQTGPVEIEPTRVLGIRPPSSTRHDPARVIVLTADFDDPGGFAGYRRVEAQVPLNDLALTIADARAGQLGAFASGDPDHRDLLICIHGSRDRCCGNFGARLFAELEQMQAAGEIGDDVSLWRTSHTGGHRFAPTGISFPDGLAWAWLDADGVRGLLDRSRPASAFESHLRGCSAFDAHCQAADLAALVRHGWSWLDRPRHVAPAGHSRLYEARQGLTSYEVSVESLEPEPVPPCGEPLTVATKTSRPIRATIDPT